VLNGMAKPRLSLMPSQDMSEMNSDDNNPKGTLVIELTTARKYSVAERVGFFVFEGQLPCGETLSLYH